MAFNEQHGITPRTVEKAVRDVIEATKVAEAGVEYVSMAEHAQKMSKKEKRDLIARLDAEMRRAAKDLQFERAAELRDMIMDLSAS